MSMQAHQTRGRTGERSARTRAWRRHRARRGVSDVVATILLLGLTVTLFSAIFAFVTKFPSPPAQNVDQFQAAVTTSAGTITKLSIEQTGGPNVPPNDHVYLVSSRTVTNWQFSQSSGILVSWGTGNSSSGWSTGQSWTTTFSPGLTLPTNITIYVVSSTSLLYSSTVPGITPNEPPVFTDLYTNLSAPATGAAFTIVAETSAYATTMTVSVNLAAIPGLTSLGTGANGTVSLTYSATTGLWTYNVASSKTTTAGTYEVFFSGINTKSGVKFAGQLSITISGSSTSTGGLSVTVGMSSLTTLPPPTTATASFSLSAAVTYSGSLSGKVNVTFYVNASSPTTHAVESCELFGTSAETAITGPETVTIYSAHTFPLSSSTECAAKKPPTTGGEWFLFNAVDTITAVAVGSSGISATGVGSTSFSDGGSAQICAVDTTSTPTSCSTDAETAFNYYRSTTDYCSTGHEASNNCPYLVVGVTNPLTSSVTFTATVYDANVTNNNGANSWTISSTTVAASSTAYAVVTLTNTRWEPEKAGTYVLGAFITVSLSGTITGYIYATVSVTLS